MTTQNPKVELTLPVLQDMELAATKTAEVVAKQMGLDEMKTAEINICLLYTSPSPRDGLLSRMPSSA